MTFRDFRSARDALAAAGLGVGDTPPIDDCIMPGWVTLQHPSPGTEKPRGHGVALEVGFQAVRTLIEAGLRP